MIVTKRPSKTQPSQWDIRCMGIFLVGLCTFGIFLPALFAADDGKASQKTAVPGKTAGEELPKPEDITLHTDDGVQLVITYYRSNKGKQSVPVVLLHDWKHNRTDFTKDLAPLLQSKGFAVVAADLRGHGDSTRLKTANGKDETLDASTLVGNQFNLMVTGDMKAIKDFLWHKNNAGELNLDKLCVVGAKMGAAVAVDFAWYDAAQQDVNPVFRPEYKLGRFVKALVFLSPELAFKSLSMRRAMQNPALRKDISVLILVGKDDSYALNEAKRVYAMFEREHPKPAADKEAEQQTVFLKALETKLQGANLLTEKNLKADELIAAFINLRLIKSDESKNWSWKERKLPHQ